MKTNEAMPNIGWHFQNTYATLPNVLYKRQAPTSVKAPNIVLFNRQVSTMLGLNPDQLNSKLGADYLSGNRLPENSIPIAQAYAGHQFGHFTLLGDGRAVLLGEQITPTFDVYDLQLKGAGRTPYSRRGDGRATLSSMLREYIISESMSAFNIPTTRSLAVVTTGERVVREQVEIGAVLTRISKGHLRVGTFQYAATKDQKTVKTLADYAINRYFTDLVNQEEKYLKFLAAVIDLQAELIANWQLIGFIHGVMNTDNMSIVGETIDYGPCAFMDTYKPKTVFSSIDHSGRYAYVNQPLIAQWNLARFAETLLPLIHSEEEEAIKIAENTLNTFNDLYDAYWLNGMRKKLGLFNKEAHDPFLVDQLLKIMELEHLDYTNTFLALMKRDYSTPIGELEIWINKWQERLSRQTETWDDALKLMQAVNPYVIPRNHLVEGVLEDAVKGDFSSLSAFIKVIQAPFTPSIHNHRFTLPPDPKAGPYKTYCGT